MKETLGDRVKQVRTSKRLVGSPAVVVESDQFMTSSMRRMLKAMNREGGSGFESKPDLEINPNHPIMTHLARMCSANPALAGKITEQVFDNSRIAAGLLEDPREMLNRVNELLEQLLNDHTTNS